MAFGFVLVGGRSSRMGQDKGLLRFRGVPLAQYQAAKLAIVCGRAALVGKDPQPFARIPFPFVLDEAEDHAAIYGIVAALGWSPDESSLVLATDMPHCTSGFLGAFVALAAGFDAPAVVPVWEGRAQPLCVVWRKSALRTLRDRVLTGDLSLTRALEGLGAVFVPEEEIARLPDSGSGVFRNVNTPEEYRALEEEESRSAADAS